MTRISIFVRYVGFSKSGHIIQMKPIQPCMLCIYAQVKNFIINTLFHFLFFSLFLFILNSSCSLVLLYLCPFLLYLGPMSSYFFLSRVGGGRGHATYTGYYNSGTSIPMNFAHGSVPSVNRTVMSAMVSSVVNSHVYCKICHFSYAAICYSI